jgi:predicted PurR-regulated permease PerM
MTEETTAQLETPAESPRVAQDAIKIEAHAVEIIEVESTATSGYQPQWDRLTRFSIAVALVIAGVYTLTLIGPVIQMLIFAFLLTFLMHAPARALFRRTPVSWTVSVVIMYGVLILVILGLLLVFIPGFVSGVNGLVIQAERGYEALKDTLRDYDPATGMVNILGFQLDFNTIALPLRAFILGDELSPEEGGFPITPEDISADILDGDLSPTPVPTEEPTVEEPPTTADGSTETDAVGDQDLLTPISFQQLLDGVMGIAGTVTGTLTSAITSVTGFLGTLLLALFVSFLILLDWPRTRHGIENWVSPSYRREFVLTIRQLNHVWNGFFLGQVTIGGIIGVLTWIQLTLMGVDGAEILAIITAFISLIPTLGGFISLIPLGITPLLQGSTVFVGINNGLFALLVIGINILITQIIWSVVAPMILGDALDLPLPVIIVGVFIGAAVGGILGAFLVAPIIGTARIIVQYLIHKIRMEDPYPGQEVPEPAP